MSASLPSDAVRDFLYAPLTNAPPHVLRAFEQMCDEIQGLIDSRVSAEAVLASARGQIAQSRVPPPAGPERTPTCSPTPEGAPSVAAMANYLHDRESGRRDLNPRPPEPH